MLANLLILGSIETANFFAALEARTASRVETSSSPAAVSHVRLKRLTDTSSQKGDGTSWRQSLSYGG